MISDALEVGGLALIVIAAALFDLRLGLAALGAVLVLAAYLLGGTDESSP